MNNWGFLKYQPDSEDPVYAIRGWYYGHQGDRSDHDDETSFLRGDIACMDFKHVFCCEWDPQGMTLDMDTLDPYNHALILFYTARRLMGTVTVYGTVSWDTASAKGGCISYSDLVQSRACMPSWDAPTPGGGGVSGLPAAPGGGSEFWWPIQIPREPDASRCVCTRDQIKQRIDWYLSNGKSHTPQGVWLPNEAAIITATGLVGIAMEHLYSITGTPHDASYQRARFNRVRMKLEKQRFDAACVSLMATEQQAFNALIDNGLETYLNEAMAVAPTALDLQYFYRRWPQCAPPTACFRVPLEELPADLVCHLPLYKLGLVHITYKELPDWVWTCFVIQQRKYVVPEEMMDDEEMMYEAKRVNLYFQKNPEATGPSGAGGGRRPYRGNLDAGPSTGPYGAGASELVAAAPPCVRNVMERAQFPKHMERVRLIQIMREAGVSESSAFDWFENKNAQYPHTSIKYASARNRFNYVAVWNEIKGAHHCANIIKDTASASGGGAGGATITCPFAEKTSDVAECKKACMPTDTRWFSGPHILMERALKASNPL